MPRRSESQTRTPAEFAGVRRLLIYRLGSFGDTVVALPCLHHIARLFPDAERRMLTNSPIHSKAPAASAVIGESGLVSGYINYTTGERNPLQLLKIALAVRSYRPDLLIYLAKSKGEQATRRDAKFFRLCGIGPERTVGLPLGDLAENLPLGNGFWEHESARLARTLSSLGPIDIGDPALWDMRLTRAETGEAERALAPLAGRRLIACGPGTKMQSKDWGLENWRGLLDGLAQAMPEFGLVLVGAKDDHAVSEAASAAWTGRSVNLCGSLTPRGSAAVLARAELFLGPDSGPMHVASAMGTPVASPFASRTRPGMWWPVGAHHRVVWHDLPCSNCDLETCIENQRRCLSTISVEEMLQAALGAWRAGQEGLPENVPTPVL